METRGPVLQGSETGTGTGIGTAVDSIKAAPSPISVDREAASGGHANGAEVPLGRLLRELSAGERKAKQTATAHRGEAETETSVYAAEPLPESSARGVQIETDCSAQEVGPEKERYFPKVGLGLKTSAPEAGSGGTSLHSGAGVSLPAQEESRAETAGTPRGKTPHLAYEVEANVQRGTGTDGRHEEQKAVSKSDGSAQLMSPLSGKSKALSAPEEAAAFGVLPSEGPYARGLGGRHVAAGGCGSGVPEVRQPIRARRVLLDLNSDPVDNEGSEGDNQLLNLF
jgi:hypothetical protein